MLQLVCGAQQPEAPKWTSSLRALALSSPAGLGHSTLEAATRYVRQMGAPVREARERVATEIAGAMGAL